MALPVGVLSPLLFRGGGDTKDPKKLAQGGEYPDRAGSQEMVRFSQVAFQPEEKEKMKIRNKNKYPASDILTSP